MKGLAGALGAVLLCIAAAAPAPAQEAESYVLQPGTARFSAGLRYSQYDRLFGDGGAAGLGDPFRAPLTAASYGPLAALQGQLNALLAARGSALRADPTNLTLGTPDLAVALDTRTFPFRAEVGVLPGLEVGVTLPLHRSETRVSRFGLSGGTLGLNADTAANLAAFAALGADFRALGRAPALPLAASALGQELIARAGAAGGPAFRLPSDTVDADALGALFGRELGVAPLGSTITPYRFGDLELDATYRLLSTLGDALRPDSGATGTHYRLSLTGGVRLPTGVRDDTARLFAALPPAGVAGARAGAVGDLFVGRLWATAAVDARFFGATDVVRLAAAPGTPLLADAPAATVSFTPGSELALTLIPRYQITEHIAGGAEYALLLVGDAAFEGTGAAALGSPGGAIQRLGVQMRFQTLSDWLRGAELLPAEIVFGLDRTLSGPAGVRDATTVRVTGSLFRRVF